MEFTDEVVREMLSEAGLEIKKVRDTPSNMGRSPEMTLAKEINTSLYGIGIAMHIEGRSRVRQLNARTVAAA